MNLLSHLLWFLQSWYYIESDKYILYIYDTYNVHVEISYSFPHSLYSNKIGARCVNCILYKIDKAIFVIFTFYNVSDCWLLLLLFNSQFKTSFAKMKSYIA